MRMRWPFWKALLMGLASLVKLLGKALGNRCETREGDRKGAGKESAVHQSVEKDVIKVDNQNVRSLQSGLAGLGWPRTR